MTGETLLIASICGAIGLVAYLASTWAGRREAKKRRKEMRLHLMQKRK